ncbi:sensor histidine kinase [Pontibacter mangrovi]|uniref:Sensor histidine kinase n=1 Tax=Pontibacter mangrovi TaxID=2589816 RepID=A0A501W6L4_9BACT|nr:histidine kinase [Pontibacter mangrovi]TPE42457.1 sensor histidine kinase [Pontibacter mangrovi]
MNDLAIKNIVAEPIQRNKVEFWAASTIFVFALFSLSIDYSPNEFYFRNANVVYHYYEHFFWPQLVRFTIIYLAFLLLNFKVAPRLMRKEAIWQDILLMIAVFVAVGVVTGIADTYFKAYLQTRFDTLQGFWNYTFQRSFQDTLRLLLLFGFYTFIKYLGLYLLSNSSAIQSKYRMVTQDVITVFMAWLVSVFILAVFDVGEELTAIWTIVSLSAILLYFFSFYALIPKSLAARRPFLYYEVRVLLVLALSFLPVALLLLPMLHDGDTAFGISFFNALFQLVVTAPATWVLHRRQQKGREEVYVLQRELGNSAANLDFLRSQINPHFLFNALNTLYGTALQENSERTAQGIQMLGDMMRFMLHENLQQKILLSRETEYLENYVKLQMLRTSASPGILIETNIEEVLDQKYIAPMLLIPFVENAFKHGISLQHKSWVRISLHCDAHRLYFDVYNSTHKKQEQDPEKHASGIGLQNVKQRLELLYPQRHELITRQTPEEFFVHLTLEL